MLILPPPPPPSPVRCVNRGIADSRLYRLAARFLPPAHRNSPSATRMRLPAAPRLALWFAALFAPARAAARRIVAVAIHCLPLDADAGYAILRRIGAAALCLALGATGANAQTAQDSSVDVELGGDTYTFRLADFPGFTGGTLYIESLPDLGTLFYEDDGTFNLFIGQLGRDNQRGRSFHMPHFSPANSENKLRYTPPTDDISVTATSFRFSIETFGTSPVATEATMTINLAGASTQTAASGVPTVATATGAATAYYVGVPLTASITGVTEPNGIDVATLAWKWQQGASPDRGRAPLTSDYSDIPGATATGITFSDFTPLAAQTGKHIRVCVSFMDQFSPPASEERCSVGRLVNSVPAFGDASADDQVWIIGAAITDVVLPAASGGDGALTYALIPALPAGLAFDADTRTISGTPASATSVTYAYRVSDGDSNTMINDTDTLTFGIEVSTDTAPAFAADAAIADQSWVTGAAITDLTLPAASGGNGELTYALTPALPAGLSLEPATRTISGIPRAAATSATYIWTVADADNNTESDDTASLPFGIAVEGADPGLRLRLRLFLEGPLR